MKVSVFLCFLIKVLFAEANCPSLCVCKSRQNEPTTAESSEMIKFKCGGPENPISELKEIDFSKVSMIVLNLNLSGNVISTLSRELNLALLQKLDLSKNQISLIETDAFYNLGNLQRLDLSENLIQTVYKEIFKGLHKLEKLVLTRNKIQTLAAGTFEYLTGLKQLDVSGNPLKCECDLIWFGDWSRDFTVKLLGNPKCGFPEAVAGQAVRKLKLFLDLATCTNVLGVPMNSLMLKPHYTQIVFEGDTLTVKCRAPFTPLNSVYILKWSPPQTLRNTSELVIKNVNVEDKGFAEATVSVPRLTSNHSGLWNCSYSRDNTSLTQHLEVVVITPRTRYCPAGVTSGNRGELFWPMALAGRAVRQPCGDAAAARLCDAAGTWTGLNISACPYSSETTKMLQQFALLNITNSKGTALAAALRLCTLVESRVLRTRAAAFSVPLRDADDVHFVSQAVNNYLQYAHQEKDLGRALLDILSLMLHLPHSVLLQAEQQFAACSALVLSAEHVAHHLDTTLHSREMNIALERLSMRRSSFTGVTCVWYEDVDGTTEALGMHRARQLHCLSTNSSSTPLPAARQNIISSVQIPATLLYRIDTSIDSPLAAVNKAYSLVVAMYATAALFPVLPRHAGEELLHRTKDYYGFSTKRDDMNMEITSPVVGIKLVNVTLQQRLAEPVYIMVRDVGVSLGVQGRAVMWDEHERKWNDATDTSCSVSHIVADMVVIRCYRLGYVGLLQSVERGFYGRRTSGARFKVSHPAVYVGAVVLLLCLSTNVLTYSLCYPAIDMSHRAKHTLINTWISMGALCFLYTLGIYQTENLKLCQILGLTIHYFSLSSLLWMVVTASNIHESMSMNNNINFRTAEDDVHPDVPVEKPILGLYLIGWGIALIVCGISGAVNLRDYASYSQCFLSTAPSLSALFVPAGILITFLVVIYLSIKCTMKDVNRQLLEGTQATENGDLEMWEPNIAFNNESDEANVRSERDKQHAHALLLVLALYAGAWACAAVTVYRPLPAYLPYQEDIFSILYALCATFLGTFVLFFYGIARSDVRAQWLTMQCYLGKNKWCCLNHSVSNTDSQQNCSNQNGLAATLTRSTGETNSKSSSRASEKTKVKCNDGEILKGAELNGQILQKATSTDNGSNKISNINLVVLNRQKYRSNNTVSTDVFYNLNQSNVARKFFKKQRQILKKNRFEIPNSRTCHLESYASLPLATREMYTGKGNIINSGYKVDNTNFHVEKRQLSDNNLKEIIHSTSNPNIVLEDDEFNANYNKNYEDGHKQQQQWKTDDEDDTISQNNSLIMNIYTNVPETEVPKRQIIASNSPCKERKNNHRTSISEASLSARAHDVPPMKSVYHRCSLEYSLTSEIENNLNHTYSDQTLNTLFELNYIQDTCSVLHSANEITTDTESFSHYIDYLQPSKIESKDSSEKLMNDGNAIEKSLQDTSDESKLNSNIDLNNFTETAHHIGNTEISELDEMSHRKQRFKKCIATSKENSEEQKKHYYLRKDSDHFETTSISVNQQSFENESDVYYPNYQVSEVSIRSHGLYAPSSASICHNEMNISFSNEDVSNNENQYVNYNPAWRETAMKNSESVPKFASSPVLRCHEESRDSSSPVSFVSELEVLYTQITNYRTPRVSHNENLDSTVNDDVELNLSNIDSHLSHLSE